MKSLALARLVVRDHRRGGSQDRLCRAVVLFQFDNFCAGIIFFKIEYVPDVGAAPTVDRLILIADHTDVVMVADDTFQHQVLDMVGVLVFIDHDIPEPIAITLADHLVVSQ